MWLVVIGSLGLGGQFGCQPTTGESNGPNGNSNTQTNNNDNGEGRCVPGLSCNSNNECDDGNPCTTDECNSEKCCENKPACTTPTQCNDGNSCTTDACVDECCQHTPECAVAAQCDDDKLCTSDRCSNGCCQHSDLECEDDELFCNGIESCDPNTGNCTSSGHPCGPNKLCDEPERECIPARFTVSISGCPGQISQGDNVDLTAEAENAAGTVTYQWELDGGGSIGQVTSPNSGRAAITIETTISRYRTSPDSRVAWAQVNLLARVGDLISMLPVIFRSMTGACLQASLLARPAPADVVYTWSSDNEMADND